MTVPAPLPLAHGRPTSALPLTQLTNLSVYWLGLTAIWAGLDETILPTRLRELVGDDLLGTAIGVITAAGVVMPILVQPTIGAISDHTVSRWGKRKPYIVLGAMLDVVFLWALATAQTYLALLIFYVLLQFSSNLAQGPFQGYVPDLVPASQVGRASGLMGLMIVLGQVGGTLIGSLGLILLPPGTPAGQAMFWPTVGLGILELATALVLIARVHDGPASRGRGSRSWSTIARSAWGRDILAQRSFLWLVVSRLFFLAGTGTIIRFALLYLERSMRMTPAEAGLFINVVHRGGRRTDRADGRARRTTLGSLRTKAVDLRGLRDGRQRLDGGGACSIGRDRSACAGHRGHRGGRLSGGRLGTHDRHHPKSQPRTFHGYQ